MATIAEPVTLRHYIDGRPDTHPAERVTEVTESATGAVLARVLLATTQVVDRAVESAAAAALEWGAASLSQRSTVMFAFRKLVNAHREDLARIITREHGKVLADAMGEVQRGLEILESAWDAFVLEPSEQEPAAIALRNLEIFERDGVLENVRANEAHLADRMNELRELPIVGDVRGAGYFWAVELVPDGAEGRFDAEQRERLLRGFLPGRLIEARLIARGDDRGDTVIQVAPPLIADVGVLDDLVDRLRGVLEDAAVHMGLARVAEAV